MIVPYKVSRHRPSVIKSVSSQHSNSKIIVSWSIYTAEHIYYIIIIIHTCARRSIYWANVSTIIFVVNNIIFFIAIVPMTLFSAVYVVVVVIIIIAVVLSNGAKNVYSDRPSRLATTKLQAWSTAVPVLHWGATIGVCALPGAADATPSVCHGWVWMGEKKNANTQICSV